MDLRPPSVSDADGESRPPAPPDDRSDGLTRRGARGAVGGGIATGVMTAYRMPVSDSLPPTAAFWARYVAGGDPEDHPLAALGLHLGYGAAAGIVFGILLPTLEGRNPGDPASEGAGTVLGVLYALALSAFGSRVVLGRLLGMDLDGTERLVFHVGHAVYGLSLGSWVASGTTAGDLLRKLR